MGQDARVRYTKMVIQEKFISLLKEKPLNKITVKEICLLAEINRATFYKYYNDAYDLLQKIEDTILNEMHDTVQHSLHGGIHKTLVRILEKMKKDGQLYITLFSQNGDPSFPIKIFQLCYKEINEHINTQFPKLTDVQKTWIYVYVAQGSSSILNCWITEGMEQSPEEVAAFIEKLIASTLKNI